MFKAALTLTTRFVRARKCEAGHDLRTLSDRCLQDIGVAVHRSSLDRVKPFWMA